MVFCSQNVSGAILTLTGPEFAQYSQSQNAAIKKGSVKGENLNLVALGINNGWFDGTLQYKAYIDYALNVSVAFL